MKFVVGVVLACVGVALEVAAATRWGFRPILPRRPPDLVPILPPQQRPQDLVPLLPRTENSIRLPR